MKRAFLFLPFLLFGCMQGATDGAAQAESAPPPDDMSADPDPDSVVVVAGDVAGLVPSVGCYENEEVIFQCTVRGGRRVVVCSSDSGDGKRVAKYRFGKEASEITLPDLGNPPPRFGSVPLSGGGEGQVEFRNGNTRYIVYSRIVRTHFVEGEPNYPAITDGLLVLEGDKLLTAHQCDGQGLTPLHFDRASRAMERVDHLFTEATAELD